MYHQYHSCLKHCFATVPSSKSSVPLALWFLIGNGGMGYRDYYTGPLRDYHGISPIPYYAPGSWY